MPYAGPWCLIADHMATNRISIGEKALKRRRRNRLGRMFAAQGYRCYLYPWDSGAHRPCGRNRRTLGAPTRHRPRLYRPSRLPSPTLPPLQGLHNSPAPLNAKSHFSEVEDEVGAGGLDGCGVEAVGVGCEHGLPCAGEGFSCRDECDDAVGVAGVHASSSRSHCATPIDLPYNLQGDLRNIFASVGTDFSWGSGWKAADRESIRASVATLAFPTKSPLNWARARWPEGFLFGHWRSGVTFAQVSCPSTRRGVREHPAPSGALRLVEFYYGSILADRVREHPAPSGALRLQHSSVELGTLLFESGSTQHHQVH